MGGMFKTPAIPKPPPLPETPRLPVETDPDIEKRAKRRAAEKRKGLGRRGTIMASGNKQRESLGGTGGKVSDGMNRG